MFSFGKIVRFPNNTIPTASATELTIIITKEVKYRRVKKSSRIVRDRNEWIQFQIPTIIADDGTFERAQELLTHNKDHSSKNRKHPYLLTGKIYCGCGHKRIGDGRQIGHCYYRCAQRLYKHPKPSEYTLPGINVKALGEETERYGRAYGQGGMKFGQYKKLTQEVSRKQESLRSQKAELEAKDAFQPNTPERIQALSVAAIKALKKMSPSNQKKLISHIIKKVVVYDKEVEVTVHIPVPSSSLCKLTKKVELYATDRHPQSLIPTIEFDFYCYLPNPRITRLITQRDGRGRIVHSKPPRLKV